MVKIFRGYEFTSGVRIVSRQKLFISGWWLLPTLKELEKLPSTLDSNSDVALAIKFEDNVAVSCALYANGLIMAFTKVNYRRKGYGSECINALKSHNPYMVPEARPGVAGAENFWSQNGVYYNEEELGQEDELDISF